MNFDDVSFYFTANNQPSELTIKKILETCQSVDLCSSSKPVIYNGLEGYDKEVTYEFELTPTNALAIAEKFTHNNFTFLEWDQDELLSELAEILEEIGEESNLKTDSIFLLVGPHEILSLEDKRIIQADFSLAFYFETSLKEDVADLNLRARKDRRLQEKIALLQDICHTNFKIFFGGA